MTGSLCCPMTERSGLRGCGLSLRRISAPSQAQEHFLEEVAFQRGLEDPGFFSRNGRKAITHRGQGPGLGSGSYRTPVAVPSGLGGG